MDKDLLTERLGQIENMRENILAAGDEAQNLRRLPDNIVEQLIDEGFFRFALPPEMGGDDASSTDTIEILEHMAAIDASVAWNVMLGSEINAMAVGGMDPDIAQDVYLNNPRVIMCGGGGPGSTPPRAERSEDGGVRVWGQSTFISGCHNATWCFMGAPLMQPGKDEPELDANGAPTFKMWFMHRDQWEILDTWDVAGLRGSGSHDVRADGAHVPKEHIGVDLFTVPPNYPNPVYRMPVPLRLSYNKVAIALGVAKGAIEAFADLAQNKIPMLSSSTLAKRPMAQSRMGEAVASYRAVRAYVMQSMQDIEDELAAGAPAPGKDTTINARLACTHGANVCMQVVDLLHNSAGTSGMRMHSPLERKLRDSHACATHRWVAHPLYQDLGSIFLGNEPDPEFTGEAASPSAR